jgi:hypothetical protein
MAGDCDKLWRDEKYTNFQSNNLNETDHLGDQGVDGRIVLHWIWKT